MLTGPSLLMCAYKMPVVGKSTEMVVHQDAQRNKHWVRSCTDKNSTFLALKCIAYNVKQTCIFLLQHCKCAEMLKNGSHWKNLKIYLLGTGFPSTRQPVTFCNVCGDWLTWLYFLLRFHGPNVWVADSIFANHKHFMHFHVIFAWRSGQHEKKPVHAYSQNNK